MISDEHNIWRVRPIARRIGTDHPVDERTSGRTAAPTDPGDLIVFDGLTHHGTPANPTDHRRRSLPFHYAPADTPATSDQDRLRLFGSEGKNVEC